MDDLCWMSVMLGWAWFGGAVGRLQVCAWVVVLQVAWLLWGSDRLHGTMPLLSGLASGIGDAAWGFGAASIWGVLLKALGPLPPLSAAAGALFFFIAAGFWGCWVGLGDKAAWADLFGLVCPLVMI
ncbi:hypothetical protein U1Q18_002570 [Sarracenia purpurea var. burkii]